MTAPRYHTPVSAFTEAAFVTAQSLAPGRAAEPAPRADEIVAAFMSRGLSWAQATEAVHDWSRKVMEQSWGAETAEVLFSTNFPEEGEW
jgi:hypothetical protein